MRNYKAIPLWKKVKKQQWRDWKWQLSNAVINLDQLEQVITLSPQQKKNISKASEYLKMRISPHITTLMDPDDKKDSLRLQFIPSGKEVESLDEKLLFQDVNADDRYSPVEGLIHRYPSKVLIFPTNYCGSYCRYCFRRKFIREYETSLSEDQYEQIFKYISKHKEIEEVILSGGDALVLDDDRIRYILKGLSKIPTVTIMRIHTRIPVTVPYRITDEFVRMLKNFKPIYMVIHIDTPKEISPQFKEVINKLVDNGIPCLASCPLLKGINDNAETLRELWTELIKIRVKPYYLFHSDPVKGLLHFLVPLEKGVNIMRELYDNMSGLAMPHYCFNIPDGGGHVLIDTNSIKKISKRKYELTNFEGKKYIYNDLGVE